MEEARSMSIPAEITAVQAGNEAMFETWFHRYYAELGRFAASFLSDPEEARDLVQRVFVKLWEKRAELPADLKLRSYLFTAVRNACYNLLEHKKVRHQHSRYTQQQPTAWEVSPEILLEAKELAQRIDAAIDALPDRCREAFVLSRKEGLSYQEIADQMGISRKTVEAQMGKALKLLREALGDTLAIWVLWLGEMGNW
jgi:RNA polymerase sigma-70 factor (ECF subfamily)